MAEIALGSPIGARSPGPFERARFAVSRALYRLFPGKSNAETYAEAELARLLGDPDGDEMQLVMNKHLVRMVRVFAREGHSGFSAGYAIACLEKLLRFEPLTPLTGEEDEWNDISDMHGEPCWQNRRCGRVFRDATGAYDIEGKVFVDPDGCSYTSRDSRVYITFPYRPHTEIVHRKGPRPRDGNGRFAKAVAQ